jgi:hypothetical protein
MIITVARHDLKICAKEFSAKKANVIQISFAAASIMWDLDTNQEVTYIPKLNDFASQKAYIPTGFMPFWFKDERKHMSGAKWFYQNETRSIIITPDVKATSSALIKTYSGINLMDVMAIRSKI